MTYVESPPETAAETTDPERRVLAHERILQALIACMARTEPRFVVHLRNRFVEPMRMVRHEHDHRAADDYAEKFIRAVMLLGEARAPQPRGPELTDRQYNSAEVREGDGPFVKRPARIDRVQVRERSGIWEVKVDGRFRGDYHQKEHALAAAALLRVSLR